MGRPLLDKLGDTPKRRCVDCNRIIGKTATRCRKHAAAKQFSEAPIVKYSDQQCSVCGCRLGERNKSGVCRAHRYDNGKPERKHCVNCAVAVNRNNTTGYCSRCVKEDRSRG
jgi:hypothetical protein